MRGLYLTSDLLFSSRVTQAARGQGLAIEVIPSAELVLHELTEGDVSLVILDLARAAQDLAQFMVDLRKFSETATVVAYGPHVDDDALTAARSAGCDLVLTRGQFDREMKQVLARFIK